MSDRINGSRLLQTYLTRRETLRRFLIARTGSAEEADDILQDLFLKLDKVSNEAEIQDPGAYLFRLASNLVVDRARQRTRGRTRDGAYNALAVEHSGGEPVADAPGAERALAARQRLEALTRRLDSLPAQIQQAFRLHKFEGLTHAETAARMGVSKSTIEKHISAALKRLTDEDA